MTEAEGKRLDGKVAIVTGAGSRADGIGNGRAAAVLLARHGARVALVDAIRGWAEDTARMIAAERGEAEVLEADVTDPAACAAAVRAAASRWGRLDILVNNVGIGGPPGSAGGGEPAAWGEAPPGRVHSRRHWVEKPPPAKGQACGGALLYH